MRTTLLAGAFGFLLATCSYEKHEPQNLDSTGTTETDVPATSSTDSAASDLEFQRKVREIAEKGTGGIPGLAPDANNPQTIIHMEATENSRNFKNTEVFSVDEMWAISWVAGPPENDTEIRFFGVELFSAEDKEGQQGTRLITAQWDSFLDPPVKSSILHVGQGGRFYLRVGANVPYKLDVRRP
jgi:hypothetical protein